MKKKSKVRPIISEETREIRQFFLDHKDHEDIKFNFTNDNMIKSRTVSRWPNNGSHCILYCEYINITEQTNIIIP